MPKEEKRRLFGQLDDLKKDMREIRTVLNSVNKEKEEWFSKKETISTQIRESLRAIKEQRQKRDEFTVKVRELKQKRDEWNKKVQDNISVFKKLSESRKKATDKKKKDPMQIKSDIDRLEMKIQTDVMSFEKEKELTKQIKVMKKELAEFGVLGDLKEGMKSVNSTISDSKKESETAHQEIQKLASESQALHESILEKSKKVDELKPKEQEAITKCQEFKVKFKEINDQFKVKITQINEVQEKLKEFRLEDSEKKKLDDTQILKEKELELEEKIKTGKKLTTDDFYIFQHANEMKGK